MFFLAICKNAQVSVRMLFSEPGKFENFQKLLSTFRNLPRAYELQFLWK